MNLEQSGSAPMVTMFISNSLVGDRVMSVRGKPFHHNTATSKENTGVFSLFASLSHCTCILHYTRVILFCVAPSAMFRCEILLTERSFGVKRKCKEDVQDRQIVLFFA